MGVSFGTILREFGRLSEGEWGVRVFDFFRVEEEGGGCGVVFVGFSGIFLIVRFYKGLVEVNLVLRF